MAIWTQLAVSGKFNGHKDGPFALNANVFDQCVRNFDADSVEIQWDISHRSETEGSAEAVGWISRLERRGDSLWGLTTWLPETRQAIQQKRWQYASPAIRFNSRDPVSGRDVGAKLSSMALVSRGFLKNLAPVTASDSNGTVVACGEVAVSLDLTEPATDTRHPTNIYAAQCREQRRQALAARQATPPIVSTFTLADELRSQNSSSQKAKPMTQLPEDPKSLAARVRKIQETRTDVHGRALNYDQSFSLALTDRTAGYTVAMADASTSPSPVTPAIASMMKVVDENLVRSSVVNAIQTSVERRQKTAPAVSNLYAAALEKIASSDPPMDTETAMKLATAALKADEESVIVANAARANPTPNKSANVLIRG
jgi:hypothetical protein